jgi:hypothetical protein
MVGEAISQGSGLDHADFLAIQTALVPKPIAIAQIFNAQEMCN